jgi:hypothetical protein
LPGSPQREVRLLITKRTVVSQERGRGEPKLPAKGTPVVVRLPLDVLDALDTFILDEDQPTSRPRALQRLVADALIRLGYLPVET